MQGIDRKVRIDALGMPTHNSVCAIKLLLVHALRTSAVSASSWDELKTSTLQRKDKCIQWTTPHRPIISAIYSMGFKLDLERPAPTSQVLKTVNYMSVRASFIKKVVAHDIRHGSVADIAHINQSKLVGYATSAVATAVGHKQTSFVCGTTDRYIDGSDVSTWTLRAELDWVDSRRM